MGRKRFRRRSTRERTPREPHVGTCEFCGDRGETVVHVIDRERPHDARNRAYLCRDCHEMACHGGIAGAILRAIARDREDQRTRNAMGHAAYAREGHGAVRQIR